MTTRRNDWLFWDVDTQRDFMEPDGKLFVPGADAIVGHLARLTLTALGEDIAIFASADDHEPFDAEISDQPDFETTFPPHCMRGTPGADRIAETTVAEAAAIGPSKVAIDTIPPLLAERPALIFLKKTFDVFSNPNTESFLAALAPERVVVYGVALDICNRFAIDGLLARGHQVTVITDATAAIDAERGRELLAGWGEKGVDLRPCDEFVREHFG